jgi:alpha-glucosidase
MQTRRNLSFFAAALLFAAATPVSAALRTLGAVETVVTAGDSVTLSTASGAKLRIGFVTPDVVRVRMSPSGEFARDFSYAIAGPLPHAKAAVAEDDAQLELRSASGLRVVVRKRPEASIAVYDASGKVVVADDPRRPTAFDPQDGAIETSKQRDDYELYYGFGEKTLPISRHQQYMTMWNTDAPDYPVGQDPMYQSVPFFIALREGRSYGVFFDNTRRSWFDMGKTDPHRYAFGADGGELDYYLFTGGAERTPANVLRDYTALTGRGPLPPLWSLGYQQSRWSYMTQERALEVAKTFRAKRIPADVIYLDIDHMDGFRVFTWNRKTFPQPRRLLSDLQAQGFHAVTIVDPGIKADEDWAIYRSGREQGIYVRNADGSELRGKVWPGICAFPDFTSAKARAWFGGLYEAALDDGVDGFWNDMNEPAVFAPDGYDKPEISHGPQKTFALDARHAGDGEPGDHARYHNVYGMQMARASFEGLRKLRPERRPLVITRAGYAGVQRYSAVWTGDNSANWSHLALTIPMLTGMSVSGIPFVGADAGGFMGGDPDAELYTRWLQAAALTPFFRVHSNDTSAAREPWMYGEEHEAINRATIELRYRLLPYLYSLFADSEKTGLPPMRPLWFAYPRDVAASLIEGEYLVGGDLLVAPVVKEGRTKREVYLPAGDAWIDWWSGKRYPGGTRATVAAPLDRLPLFVRAGASVPTQPVLQNTGEMKGAPLTLTVAWGAEGISHVFQDAGDGYAYRNGGSRTITVTQDATGVKLDVPRNHGYQRLAAVEFIGVESAPAVVRIDGKVARDVRFDADTRRLRVPLADEGSGTIVLDR